MGYLSGLIDFNGELEGDKAVIYNCHEIAGAFDMDIDGDNCSFIIDSNSKNAPVVKYLEYHGYCMKNMLIPAIKPDVDLRYLAGLFDWFAYYKINQVENRYYPQVIFRNKTLSWFLCSHFGKPMKDSLVLHSKEILYFLENTKDYLLIKNEEAQVMLDCAIDSKNPYNKERMDFFKKK